MHWPSCFGSSNDDNKSEPELPARSIATTVDTKNSEQTSGYPPSLASVYSEDRESRHGDSDEPPPYKPGSYQVTNKRPDGLEVKIKVPLNLPHGYTISIAQTEVADRAPDGKSPFDDPDDDEQSLSGDSLGEENSPFNDPHGTHLDDKFLTNFVAVFLYHWRHASDEEFRVGLVDHYMKLSFGSDYAVDKSPRLLKLVMEAASDQEESDQNEGSRVVQALRLMERSLGDAVMWQYAV